MFEDVTDGDEYREPEKNNSFDAMTTLLLKSGSRRGLRLRDLRLMGATLSSFPLTGQLSSATGTLVGHEHTSSDRVTSRRGADQNPQEYDET